MFKLILLLVPLSFIVGCNNNLKGFVYDCNTGIPIDNAQVIAKQTGWGESKGVIVWDKTYKVHTKTNMNGNFGLSLKFNAPTQLLVFKNGYSQAEQYEYPGNKARIGLMPIEGKIKSVVTNNCKPASSCLQCSENKGVTECRNTCFD